MVQLNNEFDIIGHDPHRNAGAGLLTVLSVANAPNPYSALPASGTPVAGSIFRGAIVVMNSNGEAELADSGSHSFPQMPFVTVDGDQDYDGAFVHKITCIQGGAEFQLNTTNFEAGSYTIGTFLTWGTGATAGKFIAAVATAQIYGMVGQIGYDANDDTLHVIIPQGISPQMV